MLTLALQPGRYVLAISGGVDSMSLLHAVHGLKKQQDKAIQSGSKKVTDAYSIVVAHFDHGIRMDSALDRKLVAQMAKKYNLPFVYENGNLGLKTSENSAREARYAFLRKVQQASKAEAIVTAHHLDDMIETAVFNMIRGTGRRGVSALKDYPHLRRPLLSYSKKDIQAYAKDQGLLWREDSTNLNTDITRNYIRRILLPKLKDADLVALTNKINHLKVLNHAIDTDIVTYLHFQPSTQSLDRHAFIQLPHSVALEIIASWLRLHNITTYDKKLLETIVTKCKTLKSGKQIDIDKTSKIVIGDDLLMLVKIDK